MPVATPTLWAAIPAAGPAHQILIPCFLAQEEPTAVTATDPRLTPICPPCEEGMMGLPSLHLCSEMQCWVISMSKSARPR